MGFIFAALLAGYRPKTTPMIKQNTTAISTTPPSSVKVMSRLDTTVVLCMMGCGLGIFLSWAILQTVTTVVSSLDMTFTLDGGVVLIAVVFCFIIGVVFGLYPANKAAKMKPIDALHYGG